MGMYTGLRFKIELNDFGKQVVNRVNNRIKDNCWDFSDSNIETPEVFNVWKSISRCNFIPYGNVCYMPSDWSNLNKFDGHNWEVCCSLKNYENEIEFFWNNIIPLICDKVVYAEMLYEECREPSKLTLKEKNNV